MIKNKLVVADADALIALVYPQDVNHNRMKKIISLLLDKSYVIQFPNTALLEAITTLKRALGQSELAHEVNTEYLHHSFHIFYVDAEIQERASRLFADTVSKKNTIFDAVVLATAQKQKAEAILSLDGWYKKQGYKTAEELV